jgi:hypothetical protein
MNRWDPHIHARLCAFLAIASASLIPLAGPPRCIKWRIELRRTARAGEHQAIASRIAAGALLDSEGGNDMTSTGSSDPARQRTARDYYPWWLDKLADDVTAEGAAMQGVLQGAENVRRLVLDARALYEHQEFEFTGDYGDNGFLEEYGSNGRN